jgi:mannosyltransferase OCH1-like enzyme
MVLIVITIVVPYFFCTLHKEHFATRLSELQKKTGRDYSDCVIKNSPISRIDKINMYLAKNPQKIPKIIHQIWIGPKKPPWKWINSFKNDFRRKYPGWKYYLWTNERVKTFNIQNRKEYDYEKSYAGKADILRYELLHKFGGIYIDADSHWLGLDLEDLIRQTNYTGVFVGNECKKCQGSLANGVMGSSANNPITKYLIETLHRNYFLCNNDKQKCKKAYKTTGPYFIDQVLIQFKITIFPYYYFYPIYWLGKKSVKMDLKTQKKRFPKSYMTQFGYTTHIGYNNIS